MNSKSAAERLTAELTEQLSRIMHDAATGKICPDPDDATPYARMAAAVVRQVVEPLLRENQQINMLAARLANDSGKRYTLDEAEAELSREDG